MPIHIKVFGGPQLGVFRKEENMYQLAIRPNDGDESMARHQQYPFPFSLFSPNPWKIVQWLSLFQYEHSENERTGEIMTMALWITWTRK